MKKLLVSSASVCLSVFVAWGAQITPASYTGPNGGTGYFDYFDDTYNGLGNNTVPYATLSGGNGQLTDNITVTTNWYADPGPWVGWLVIPFDLNGNRCQVGDVGCQPGLGENPRITFLFPAPVSVGTVSVHVDDSNGFGAVRPPLSIEVLAETAGGGITYSNLFTLTDPVSSDPKWYDLNVSGLTLTSTTDRLVVRLLYRDAWLLADEIRFDDTVLGGSLVGGVSAPTTSTPEPASVVLCGLGLAGLAFWNKRRQTVR